MITRIQISNFRSLRNVDVELGPLTVLIGRGGSGKTNFAHALRYLSGQAATPIRGDVISELLPRLGGQEGVFCAVAPPSEDRLSFRAWLELPRTRGSFFYHVVFHRNGSLLHESLDGPSGTVYAQQWDKNSGNTKWTHPPRLANVPSPDAGVQLSRLRGINEVHVTNLALARGIGCYDFPSDVLTQKDSKRPTVGSGLCDDGRNAIEIYDGLINNLSTLDAAREILAAAQRLNPSISSIDLSSSDRGIYVGHRFGNSPILAIRLAQESEGLRRFLAHQIALYQQPPKQLLVFEEPEKGLYPGALAALADSFQAAVSRGGMQIVLITHSPQLLDNFSVDQIRVVEIENYETRIGPLAAEQRDAIREQLMRPYELLTVDPARLADAEAPIP